MNVAFQPIDASLEPDIDHRVRARPQSGSRHAVRKIGGTTLRSIGDIARHQRLLDNDAEYVTPEHMLLELAVNNQNLTLSLRVAHAICDEYNEVASASLIENWIDETERRTWFLSETVGERE